jgi:hypothetical protein
MSYFQGSVLRSITFIEREGFSTMAYNSNNKGSYNNNQQSNQGGFARKPAENEAPAAADKKDFTAKKPDATIKIQKEGETESTRLTGLWKETSKAGGTYYRGKAADGTTYIMFLND